MKLKIVIRNILFFLGYYSWRFSKKYAPSDCSVGFVRYSFQDDSCVSILAKRIGDTNIGNMPVSLTQRGLGKLCIGTGTTIRKGVSITVRGDGDVRIGDYCSIGRNTIIKSMGTEGIEIGNNCKISWECIFIPSDHHMVQIDGADIGFEDKIEIGNNVWIGARVIVLKGTKIGDNCIVAAAAVCRGNYPENSIIAGIPGKVIRENTSWRNLRPEEKIGLFAAQHDE